LLVTYIQNIFEAVPPNCDRRSFGDKAVICDHVRSPAIKFEPVAVTPTTFPPPEPCLGCVRKDKLIALLHVLVADLGFSFKLDHRPVYLRYFSVSQSKITEANEDHDDQLLHQMTCTPTFKCFIEVSFQRVCYSITLLSTRLLIR
jgi:hypothetical protein